MHINNLEKRGLTRTPQVEQAMAWLVTNGPLHIESEMPHWILRQLVHTERIARLRRGVYLAPTREGELPSAPAVAQLLAPDGYLSFYGPLTLDGLTDQDTARWVMVTGRHQAPARLPRGRVDFAVWPRRIKTASTRVRTIDGVRVRIATPAQAFMDCLEAPRFAPPAPELLHVLRDGSDLGKLSQRELVRRARALGSPMVARRLGLLIELATGKVEPSLRELAERSHKWSRLEDRPAEIREPGWRLLLPQTREFILGAAR